MPEINVENAWGVIDGVDDLAQRKSLADRLNTEVNVVGTRVKFKPTRFALDLLVSEFGRDAFGPGCRFAWGHFYKEDPKSAKEVEFNWITDPYNHQREWWSEIKDLPYFALEWEMGLGKSKTILDVCQWLYAKGELDALLVITLKGVHRKWVEKEVLTHLPKGMAHAAFWNTGIVDAGMWFGPNARNRKSIVESDRFAVATINFESVHRAKGLKFCERFCRSRKVGIVVDESQYIKSPGAAVTKAAHKLAKMAERRWITTGTMSTGSTEDPWAQYVFLDPAIVNGMKFHQWQSEFSIREQVGDKTFETWQYNPDTKKSEKVTLPVMTTTGFKNEDELCKMLDPFRSRLLKEDCLDLPPKLYRMRSFEMSEAQRRAYTQMQKEFLVQLDDGRTMTSKMAVTKLLRLHQIACGFLTPDDADPEEEVNAVAIDDKNPRTEAMMEEIEKVRNKAIVWSNWRYSLREIAAVLRENYGERSVVEYHGGVGDNAKAQALLDFKEDHVRWFVGNPQSGGVGLDLVEADNMLYYSNSYNLGLRLQSEDRFHRIGQEHDSCTITDIEALGTVDRPQLRALKDKREIAATISGDNLKQWLTEAV